MPALEAASAEGVMNECIELAKRFGTTDSRPFVNGVLDKIARQVVEKSDK